MHTCTPTWSVSDDQLGWVVWGGVYVRPRDRGVPFEIMRWFGFWDVDDDDGVGWDDGSIRFDSIASKVDG